MTPFVGTISCFSFLTIALLHLLGLHACVTCSSVQAVTNVPLQPLRSSTQFQRLLHGRVIWNGFIKSKLSFYGRSPLPVFANLCDRISSAESQVTCVKSLSNQKPNPSKRKEEAIEVVAPAHSLLNTNCTLTSWNFVDIVRSSSVKTQVSQCLRMQF